MGAKQERKLRAASVNNAELLLANYQMLFTDAEITVPKLDRNKSEDRWLALEIALRGKTEEDYFSIVDGLFRAHDAEINADKKNALTDLTSRIMSLGERNLGIDWS